MEITVDMMTPEFEKWLERQDVPVPRIGGAFAYCPHQKQEVVKERGKKSRTVYIQCKFKTRRLRKYARHYRRHHGLLSLEKAAALAAANEAVVSPKPAPRKRAPRKAKTAS